MHEHNAVKTYNVSGMHCASCASTIKRKLEKLPNVESCEVNYGTEQAKVHFHNETSTETLNKEIQKFGYTLSERHVQDTHANHDMMTPVSSDQSIKERKLQELQTFRNNLRIVTPFVITSMFIMIWEIGAGPLKLWEEIPENIMDFFHHLLPVFATYTLFVVGKQYLQGVWRFIKYRTANMDTLVGIGTLVAYLYSFMLSAFKEPLSPFLDTTQTYYDVTIVVIGFITFGKFLEARSKLKTGEAIEKLLSLQAKSATVLRDGKQVEIPIEQVVVGDVLLIKPGQKIAVDGEIIEGSTSIDESMITGESLPVDKKVGDLVIGATINKQGSLQVKATKVGSDTMLAQIIRMVEDAQGSKAPIERLADQISAIFVPVVLLFAVVTFVLWLGIGLQFMPFSQALTLGIVSMVGILVIACPCAMGLATPTAVIVGVGKAAQYGILIKNAEALEKLQAISTVVMDKTGTLTKGTPELTDIVPLQGFTEKQCIQVLASLEHHSEHPIAQAIVTYANQQKVDLLRTTDFSAIEGKGVQGKVGGKTYSSGNLKLAHDMHVEVDNSIITTFTSQGKTPIVLMLDKQVIAYVAVADTIKDEARTTVKQLHKAGMKVAMLTGDHKNTAQYIANQLNIDTVIAEVLPADKSNEIQKLQQQGQKVAMVGDGINDAPALAMADVGIAMGTGTDVAIESAGITLLGGQIAKLPQAIRLAKATMRTIKQNLFWAFFYNVVGIPVAAGVLYPFFGILLNPAIAGGAMAFSSVSVVLNALRLKRFRP